MTFGIVIPALNAARHLPELVERINLVTPCVPIIVVDDGSSDGTRSVAQQLELITLVHQRNRGKGAALKTGFAKALALGIDAVVQMDADLQHPPESLPCFIEKFVTGTCDVIVGSRDFSNRGMPWPRRISNTLTSRAVSRASGIRIPDSQCGYRLIASRVLNVVHPVTDEFDFESEFLVRAAHAGFRIDSIPIPTVYGQEHSAIRPWRDTWRFIKLMGMFRHRKPRHQLHGSQEPARADRPERSEVANDKTGGIHDSGKERQQSPGSLQGQSD